MHMSASKLLTQDVTINLESHLEFAGRGSSDRGSRRHSCPNSRRIEGQWDIKFDSVTWFVFMSPAYFLIEAADYVRVV